MITITSGERIRYARKRAGLTQKELAETIGKTESSIRKYEKGIVTIPLNVLEQIALVFDMRLFELMGIDLSDIPTRMLLDEIERRCKNGC